MAQFPATTFLLTNVLLHSAGGQDADLDNLLLHSLRMEYAREKQQLVDYDFGERKGYPRPPNRPPVRLHRGQLTYSQTTVDVTTSVVAFEQSYENHQKRNELKVRLSRTMQRSSTVLSQVIRGVRSQLKGEVSVNIPGTELSTKGATGITAVIDVRNRTSQTVTHTETFKVEQTVTVPAGMATYVRWVIAERMMVVSWEAEVLLEGYIMSWLHWEGKRVRHLQNVCEFSGKVKGLQWVNRTHCKITVVLSAAWTTAFGAALFYGYPFYGGFGYGGLGYGLGLGYGGFGYGGLGFGGLGYGMLDYDYYGMGLGFGGLYGLGMYGWGK
ncbi:uncharacterized protein LOC144161937 [Haemaphysalis longicornis]